MLNGSYAPPKSSCPGSWMLVAIPGRNVKTVVLYRYCIYCIYTCELLQYVQGRLPFLPSSKQAEVGGGWNRAVERGGTAKTTHPPKKTPALNETGRWKDSRRERYFYPGPSKIYWPGFTGVRVMGYLHYPRQCWWSVVRSRDLGGKSQVQIPARRLGPFRPLDTNQKRMHARLAGCGLWQAARKGTPVSYGPPFFFSSTCAGIAKAHWLVIAVVTGTYGKQAHLIMPYAQCYVL
jgi:hypothetical protein